MPGRIGAGRVDSLNERRRFGEGSRCVGRSGSRSGVVLRWFWGRSWSSGRPGVVGRRRRGKASVGVGERVACFFFHVTARFLRVRCALRARSTFVRPAGCCQPPPECRGGVLRTEAGVWWADCGHGGRVGEGARSAKGGVARGAGAHILFTAGTPRRSLWRDHNLGNERQRLVADAGRHLPAARGRKV